MALINGGHLRVHEIYYTPEGVNTTSIKKKLRWNNLIFLNLINSIYVAEMDKLKVTGHFWTQRRYCISKKRIWLRNTKISDNI